MSVRRTWAWPLTPIYAAALAVRNGLRRQEWLPVRRLRWPVISVGSLSAGGSGKTPVVIALASLLREHGWQVDVLSRGYRRKGRGVERVEMDAANAATRFGDEPVVVAQRAGVPVWVGKERFEAGKAAEGAEGEHGAEPSFDKIGVRREADSSASLRNDKQEVLRNDKQKRAHLLDDGFQHWGLARTVDVVLVTEEDLDEALLPAGNRREGFAALLRADVVVLRDVERERVEARVRGLMRPGAVLWSVRRETRFAELTGVQRAVVRPLAFCAIARPEGFWRTLQESGCELAGKVAFRDHRRYAEADIEHLVAMAKECGATGFITTEKDAVKLTEPDREWLQGKLMERLGTVGPVCVVGLKAQFADEEDVVRELEARCR